MNEHDNSDDDSRLKTAVKEENVLPPFDPPQSVLSWEEWCFNWSPTLASGGTLFWTFVLGAGDPEDYGFWIGATFFLAIINSTTASLWRETRERDRELQELRRELSDVRERFGD